MKELYAIVSGRISLFRKSSKDAVKFLASQDGFFAVHLLDKWHTLFLYETKNDAIKAKNMAETKGIITGKNITKFYYDEIDTITMAPMEEQ